MSNLILFMQGKKHRETIGFSQGVKLTERKCKNVVLVSEVQKVF